MDFGVKRPLFGKEIPMRTVNEVSKLTGVSIRTLQYYDSIGLLKPTEYTEVGYRLYDEEALERLQQILLFRELEFPLKEILHLYKRNFIRSGKDVCKWRRIYRKH